MDSALIRHLPPPLPKAKAIVPEVIGVTSSVEPPTASDDPERPLYDPPKENFKLTPVDPNLPDLLRVTPVSSAPPRVRVDTPERTHQELDLDLVNDNLQLIHQAWGYATSVKDVAVLVDKTISTIKARRDVLNRQYGHQSNSSKNGAIPVLD